VSKQLFYLADSLSQRIMKGVPAGKSDPCSFVEVWVSNLCIGPDLGSGFTWHLRGSKVHALCRTIFSTFLMLNSCICLHFPPTLLHPCLYINQDMMHQGHHKKVLAPIDALVAAAMAHITRF